MKNYFNALVPRAWHLTKNLWFYKELKKSENQTHWNEKKIFADIQTNILTESLFCCQWHKSLVFGNESSYIKPGDQNNLLENKKI